MGANKKVYRAENKVQGLPDPNKPTVLYTAVKTFFKSYVDTLNREMNLCKQLTQEIKICIRAGNQQGIPENGGSCLAIEHKELEDQIKGKPVYEVEEAECDGEKFIKGEKLDRDISYEDRFSVIEDVLTGFATLNTLGYAYGDGKPENFLVYKEGAGDDAKYSAKIADFGKTEKVAVDEKGNEIPSKYTGNLRFCPPEGALSTIGDSWSAALIIIRILEEPLLEKGKPLIKVKSSDKDIKAIKKRRGVEKYVTEHKTFLGMDNNNILGKIIREFRTIGMKKLSEKRKIKQQELIHNYINVLCNKLVDNSNVSNFQRVIIQDMLFEMTLANTEKRITTKIALEDFKQAMKPIGSS